MDKNAPVSPLPPEVAARVAADRVEVGARRAEIRAVIRQVEQRKRQARRSGDLELVAALNAFGRRYEAAMRRGGSLDRFPG